MSRRSPFRELEELFESVERQLGGAGPQMGELATAESSTGRAPMDVVDRDDEFEVTVELPGYEPDDVDVRVAGDTLFVDGHRDRDVSVEEDEYVRRERSHESVSRRIRLPEPPAVDDVSATMEEGVLTVTIPKAPEEERGEPIDIE